MKQELIKPIVRVGNSAGIILPKEWLNGKAKVELVEKPLDIKKEILEILGPYLHDIKGIYLVGSYAREEQTQKSDIDVLAITDKIRKKIEIGKYCILLFPKTDIEQALQNNVLPILPMLKEAKTIINSRLIHDHAKTQLTKRNLKWHIELTKSALSIDREMIKLDKEWPLNCSDSVAYSLVLRLRGVYIVNCMKKNKKWSNKELINLVEKIANSSKAYEGYLRVKTNEKQKEGLPVEEAERLHSYVIKEINKQERWAERRN